MAWSNVTGLRKNLTATQVSGQVDIAMCGEVGAMVAHGYRSCLYTVTAL